MSQLMEYKCPCCGGGIAFDSNLQKMKCPFCDTEFEMETLQSFQDEIATENGDDFSWTEESSEWEQEEQSGLITYHCDSCGAEIVADENLSASRCPYCDNPIVMSNQFHGSLKPDLIIPFKLDKKAAKAKMKEYLTGKKFLPSVFSDENHIDEIKGIYVPFWLFDSDVEASMRYKATKTRFWSDASYDYTQTSYYAVRREGTVGFDTIPVDGSSKLDNNLMESIEPFDMKDAVPFNPAFLAGYMSERYDVDSDSCMERANQRIDASTKDAFEETVIGYSSVALESSNIRTVDGKVRYALLPVWILNTTWNNEKYIFAMNGQTGKFVGDLPCDTSSANKSMAKMTAIITVAGTILMYLGHMFF